MSEIDLSKQKIIPVDIEKEMKKSFISYAMATIISRALPDVRDGLKPVHRRILYSMHELGVTPDKPHRKSVRVVGDVLGKYHPHGDMAVYDAMVRLAQPFSMRYMLVDGHGNFGSVDGDGAAAMRYTEARMSKLALQMLRDIDKETVDMAPNFDETAMQPTVLPARFPNLLVNGSSGIAVGMATNIPPHNMGEVIDAVVALLEDPELTVEELMNIIPGPDFPTGGLVMGRAGIQQAYRTGRGRIIMRARTRIEELPHNKHRIIVTEIPYQVNKAKMVEKIADLVQQKRVDGIDDIREESDRTGMRVVIDLKSDVNPDVVLNVLYKHTPMQETFGVNMLALVNGEPKVLSLKQVLSCYIAHQEDVITRRTRFDLERAQARAHIIEGLLRALDFIDAIIALIRGSKTTEEAKSGLMERFQFSDKQAQAILEMRLQRLTGLERTRLEEEYADLKERIVYFESILADEGKLRQVIREELLAVREEFADPRRTSIEADPADIDWDELIQREDMVVTITRMGYVKRTSADTYRTQNRGGMGVMGLSTREEDFVEHLLVGSTHDWLLIFTNRGRVHRLRCYQIPEAGRQARGTNLVNLIQVDPGERVQAVIPMESLEIGPEDGRYLILATRRGVVKRTPIAEYANLRNVGLKAIVLAEEDELISAQLSTGDQEIILATHDGMGIRFHESLVRPQHRVSRGVRGIRLREGDFAVDMDLVEEGRNLLAITSNGYGKRTDFDLFRTQNRGGYGLKAMRLSPKTGALVAMKVVDDGLEVMMISEEGVIIRTTARSIPTLGRATQGVRVMRLREGDQVVAVAITAAEDDDAAQDLDIDMNDVVVDDSPEEEPLPEEELPAEDEGEEDGEE